MEFEAELSRFTFWPGWEFRPYLDRHLGLMVHIVTAQPDREDPSRLVDLGIRVRVPPHAQRSREGLGEWLLWRLEEAFIHEAREGLRYDGELVDDPHR